MILKDEKGSRLFVMGIDTSGVPRQKYADRLAKMKLADFTTHMMNIMWLTWFCPWAVTRPESDYDWKVLVLREECVRRDQEKLYEHCYRVSVDQ